MTYQHRKKPIVIEAFQMTYKRHWDNSEWPKWLHEAWHIRSREGGGLWCDNKETKESRGQLFCGTLEGVHEVDFDDYIIQGSKGEIYPCKPDIFEATYQDELDDGFPGFGQMIDIIVKGGIKEE